MKKMTFQILLALTLLPLLILFEVPIEKVIGVRTFAHYLGFIFFLFFLWGIFRAITQKVWIMLTWGIGMVLFLGYCLGNPISQNLFLGKQISSAYYVEAPGYIELKIYEANGCTIGYGGIFGVSDIFYCTYRMQDEFLIIKTEENVKDLTHYSSAKINGIQYRIETE